MQLLGSALIAALYISPMPPLARAGQQIVCKQVASISAKGVRALVWSSKGDELFIQSGQSASSYIEGQLGKNYQIPNQELVVGATNDRLLYFSETERAIVAIDRKSLVRSTFVRVDNDVLNIRSVNFGESYCIALTKQVLNQRDEWNTVRILDMQGLTTFEYESGKSSIWSADYNSQLKLLLVGRDNYGPSGSNIGVAVVDVKQRKAVLDPMPLHVNGLKAIVSILPPTQVKFIGPNYILRFVLVGNEAFWSSIETGYRGTSASALHMFDGVSNLKGSSLQLWACRPDGTLVNRLFELNETMPPATLAVSEDRRSFAFVAGDFVKVFKLEQT